MKAPSLQALTDRLRAAVERSEKNTRPKKGARLKSGPWWLRLRPDYADRFHRKRQNLARIRVAGLKAALKEHLRKLDS